MESTLLAPKHPAAIGIPRLLLQSPYPHCACSCLGAAPMGLGQHCLGQLVSGKAIQCHSLDTLPVYPNRYRIDDLLVIDCNN